MVRNRKKRERPKPINDAYIRLKERLGGPLSLKRIGKHYYLYKQVIEWDRERKKYICKESSYLGKITNEGRFQAKSNVGRDDLASAKAIIASYGGNVVMPDSEKPSIERRELASRLTSLEKEMLTALTMDARMRASELAAKLKISTRRLGNKSASLERRFGMEYTPYIKVNKLGYSWFIILVRFIEGRPDNEGLKRELDLLPNFQFSALTTNGRYDMLLFITAENDEELANVLGKIKEVKALRGLKAEWYISYFFPTKGFIPIRDRFFDLLEKRVWNRRMESSDITSRMLSRNEYSTLRAMNKNAKASFAEIEKGYGMTAGTARYAYDKLRSREIISRVSINTPKLNILYNGAIVMEIIDAGEFSRTRPELLKFIEEEDEGFVTNRFCLVGDIGLPDGGLLLMPVMKEGELERVQAELAKRVKGIRVSSFILTQTLCGHLVYHRFEINESTHYAIPAKSDIMEAEKF